MCPAKVTKLVPFGAFVRVEDGIEGLVHISELAQRHVELPDQVVKVGEEVFVKVIDIDLERRRISLSLKQANEGVDPNATEFDPALYGMAAEYDEAGNYKYPEASIPKLTNGLKALTHSARLGKHSTLLLTPAGSPSKAQVAKALEEDVEQAAAAPAPASSYSSAPAEAAGTPRF